MNDIRVSARFTASFWTAGGPDEEEWEAMIDVVNALPEKWRRVVESIYCDVNPSYSIVLGHCRLPEAKLIGLALRQLFADRRPWCDGVTITGPDLPEEAIDLS